MTLIDGANIITGTISANAIKSKSIGANQIAAGAIDASLLTFTPVTSGTGGPTDLAKQVVAAINADQEGGLKISANKLTLTGLLQVGGAAADINSGTTLIDGGKIQANSIDAAAIKAGAITTDKLTVGIVQRQSLIANGHFGTYNTFGDASTGWVLSSGVSFVSQAGSYQPGGSSVALKVPSLNANPAGGMVLAQQVVAVIPGRQYTLVGLLYHDAGTAGIRVMTAKGSGDYELSSHTSPGTPAGSIVPAFYQNATYISNGASASSANARWNLYAYRVTIPADVTKVAIQICSWHTATANHYPGFIQFYDDNLNEATASLDMVNQLQNVAFGGDVVGNYAATTVTRLRNRNISNAAPSNGNILTWNTTSSWWEPQTVASALGYTPANKAGDTFTGPTTINAVFSQRGGYAYLGAYDSGNTYPDTTGGMALALGWNFSNGLRENTLWNTNTASGGAHLSFDFRQVTSASTSVSLLKLDNTSGISATFGGVVNATQFNGSGAGLTGTAASLTAGNAINAGNADTLDGVHLTALPVDAGLAGTKNDWSTRAPRSGFYEADTGTHTGLPTGPGTSGYMHIINCQHSSGANNFALQIAAGFGPGGGSNQYSDLFWRVTNNDGTRAWRTVWDTGNFDPNTKANITSPSFNTSITTPLAYVSQLVIGYTNEINHTSSGDLYLGYRTTNVVRFGQSKVNIICGSGRIESNHGGAWLVPAGTTGAYAGFHFNQHPPDRVVGITSAGTSTGTQGGVLIQGSGAYGTKIRFMTTDTYATGMKLSMTLDHHGHLWMERGGSIWNAGSLETNNSKLYLGTDSSPWSPGAQTSAGAFKSAVVGDTKFMFYGDSGAMSVYANGFFFQNNGQYKVLDSSGSTPITGDQSIASVYSTKFRTRSTVSDTVDGAPWYGLGDATIELGSGTGVATQLAGRDGVRIRSANNFINVRYNKDNTYYADRTNLFYSGTAAISGAYYQSAAIQIREVGLVGAAQSSYAYAPKIGFNWSGRVAGNLLFDADGNYRFMDADCNAHAGVYASAFRGSIKPGGSGNVSLDEGMFKALRITTAGKWYVDIGPMNSAFCHYETDRPTHYFNKPVHVQGDVRIYTYNTRMHKSGFDVHAENGAGLKFWDGADGSSITMNDYNSSGYSGDAYHTGGSDYNMVLRMDGDDAHRGGSDHLARGFLFRNNSLNGSYAHIAPFGNHTYWGGMLALRDVGNNSWYGLYFLNGVMYVKKLA